MTTARDFCTRALRKLGVVGVGQDPGAEDINDAFADLTGMIDQWRVNRWHVFHLVDKSFTGTGAQTYTIGPGGIIDVTERPDRLESAYLIQTQPGSPTPVSFPLRLIESYEDYARITLKTLSTLPWAIFYDPVYPMGLLYPWPLPTNAYQVHILIKDILTGFADLNANMNLPSPYYEAILYNLCIRVATSYPGAADISPTVEMLARTSLSTIVASNTAIPLLRMPKSLVSRGRSFNIYSGY